MQLKTNSDSLWGRSGIKILKEAFFFFFGHNYLHIFILYSCSVYFFGMRQYSCIIY